MIGFLGAAYPWVLALHIISIITWMAGLLYLPRLYVYHAQAEAGGEPSETFKVMERRLLRAIMNPSMIVAWILGLMLVAHLGAWTQGWMHAKFALVIALSALHMAYAKWRKDFEADRNARGHVFYRVMNEVPTLLMILTVILVAVKPF
jgi:putative membrane protein